MSKDVSRRTFIQTGTGLITTAWGGLRIFAGPESVFAQSKEGSGPPQAEPREFHLWNGIFFARQILPVPCATTC